MGIRNTLNGNPVATIAVAIVVSVGAIWFCVGAMRSGPPDTSRAFFTTDDGKTWFVDSSSNVPPFEKNGATAYRCSIYECNGKQFVLQLERYDEQSAKTLREARAQAKSGAVGNSKKPNVGAMEASRGLQVKAPGEKDWHGLMDRAAIERLSAAVKCGSGYAKPVLP